MSLVSLVRDPTGSVGWNLSTYVAKNERLLSNSASYLDVASNDCSCLSKRRNKWQWEQIKLLHLCISEDNFSCLQITRSLVYMKLINKYLRPLLVQAGLKNLAINFLLADTSSYRPLATRSWLLATRQLVHYDFHQTMRPYLEQFFMAFNRPIVTKLNLANFSIWSG